MLNFEINCILNCVNILPVHTHMNFSLWMQWAVGHQQNLTTLCLQLRFRIRKISDWHPCLDMLDLLSFLFKCRYDIIK
jgi:hypothetical protein